MELGAICGMTEPEFWNCTPRYLAAKIKALEAGQRVSWEQSRYIAFHAIKVGDSKNRLKKLDDLGKFPWEKSKVIQQSPEDLQKFSDEADEVLRVMYPGLYEKYQSASNAN
jgi:hypothetical protein